MAKYGMAIDLDKCVGCGACALACKSENNTEYEKSTVSYNWADFYIKTEGAFGQGNFKYWVFPTLCNHCTNASCVNICPVNPKALFKTESGITMQNHDRCIGCRLCIDHCPYSNQNLQSAGVQYSVLHYNKRNQEPHSFYDDQTAIINGCTMSPAEVASLVNERPPDRNEYYHPDYKDVRPADTTEKCTFCEHRVVLGEQPFCVVSCPTHARMFGDLDNSASEINQWLAKGYARLKNNKGDLVAQNEYYDLMPNVFYLGDFGTLDVEEQKVGPEIKKARLYPNPASTSCTLELNIESSGIYRIEIFGINGQMLDDKFFEGRLERGIQNVALSVSHLKSGTYILRIIGAPAQLQTVNLVVSR